MIKIITFIICFMFAVSAYATPLQFHSEIYMVKHGDTVDSIASHYATKANISYGDKYKAFREGIVEWNYDKVKDGLKVGETLTINYWTENI